MKKLKGCLLWMKVLFLSIFQIVLKKLMFRNQLFNLNRINKRKSLLKTPRKFNFKIMVKNYNFVWYYKIIVLVYSPLFFHKKCDKVGNRGDIYYLIYNPISSLVREENRLVSKITIVMISKCWVYKHKKSHFKLLSLEVFAWILRTFYWEQKCQVPSMDITLESYPNVKVI